MKRNERGAITADAVIVLPVATTLLLASCHFVVLGLAKLAAQTAADEGLSAATTYNGSAADGQSAAVDLLAGVAGNAFQSSSATASRSADAATVTVSGEIKWVVPFLPTRVQETSTGPVEDFVEEQ